VLNNLVAELLNVTAPPRRTKARFQFVNPQEGWIFISSRAGADAADPISLALDGQPIHAHTGPGTLEAMRMVFYPYCGPMHGAKASRDFIQTVMDAGWRFAFERYLTEQRTERATRAFVDARLRRPIASWRETTARLPHRQFLCRGMIEIFLLFSDSKFNKVIPLAV